MYSDKILMDKFAEDFGALKVSVLTKANEIKPYVRKVTIGPNACGEDEIRVTLTEFNDNNESRPTIKSRLGHRVPKTEETHTNINNYHNLEKSSNINIDMLRYETEKMNKNVVRKKVQAYQARFARAEEELQSKSNQEYTARRHCLNQRLEKIESDILQDIELYQRDVKLQQQQKKQEHEEQCQLLHEKTLALRHEQEIRIQRLKKKEELDAIYISQKSFREIFQNILRELKSLNSSIAQQVYTEHSNKLKVLNNSMEELTRKCAAGDTNAEYVSQAQHLVDEMKKLCNTIMLEYKKLQQIRELEAQQNLVEKQSIVQNQNTPSITVNQNIQETSTHKIRSNEAIESEHGSLENWRKFAEYQNFIKDFASKYQQIKEDKSLKKFRFSCQKAVNIPVNTIAGKGVHHTQDKFKKLDALLAGQPVQIGDMQVCAAQHPQGVPYCYDLLAKSIVKQGAILSGNLELAYPIAYVTVALWSKYPDFGKLLLGYFYEKCPYLVPVNPAKIPDMSQEEYLRLQGYEISSDGVLENKDLFLKRLCGLGRLYFAMTVVQPTGGPRPFGLGYSWKWLSSTLNLPPLPDISATLILQCLEVTGFGLISHFRKQFLKNVKFLTREYIPKLDQVCQGGPKARLKEFLIKLMETGMIEPPREIINVSDIEYL